MRAGGPVVRHTRVLLMRRIATALLAWPPARSVATPPAAHANRGSVDLKRYAGMWYEIANFPMVFQRDCVGDTTAEYTLHPDGSVGVNRCRNKDGVDSASGTATVVEGSNNAKLEVTFLPLQGDYWIIGLDPEYRWPWSARPTASICGSCRARPSCRRKTWTARWPPPRRRAISWMSCGIRRRSSVHVSPAIIF